MICTWGLRRHQRLVGRACWEPFLFLFRWTGGVTLPILASTQTSEMADVWVHDLPSAVQMGIESHVHFVTMRGADPRYLSSPSAAGVMRVDQDQLTAGDFD